MIERRQSKARQLRAARSRLLTHRSPGQLERAVAALYQTPPALVETVKKLVPNVQ